MFGVGAVELLILIAIAVILFGAPILTFLVGYALGKKQAGSEPTSSEESPTPSPAEEHSDR